MTYLSEVFESTTLSGLKGDINAFLAANSSYVVDSIGLTNPGATFYAVLMYHF